MISKSYYQIKNGIKRRLFAINRFRFGYLGHHAVIIKPILISGRKYIQIGKNVKIGEYARIEAVSKRNKEAYIPKLVIGDNTTFEQFAHITCASNLKIGRNCTFLSRVMVTTISHKYDKIGKPISMQNIISKDVTIGDNCFICMDVKIFPGVQIGDNVIIGANSIVMDDLPSYTVCVGVPAIPIKKFNFEKGTWEKYES